jgi:hypothetical protein
MSTTAQQARHRRGYPTRIRGGLPQEPDRVTVTRPRRLHDQLGDVSGRGTVPDHHVDGSPAQALPQRLGQVGVDGLAYIPLRPSTARRAGTNNAGRPGRYPQPRTARHFDIDTDGSARNYFLTAPYQPERIRRAQRRGTTHSFGMKGLIS